MGKMTCNWKLGDVRKTIDFVIEKDLKKVEDELFNVCLSIAKSAKDGHTYKNYKGQLESSVGVIILKNRQEVTQWSMVASSGSDPAKGLQDIKNLIYNKIVGKHSLPDGTFIPSKSLVGIVFAAAPYSGEVQGRGRKVLIDFAQSDNYVLTILKTVIK